MSRLLKGSIIVAILLLLVVGILATRGPAAPSANPPGAFSFAVLGDAPYYVWEESRAALEVLVAPTHAAVRSGL